LKSGNEKSLISTINTALTFASPASSKGLNMNNTNQMKVKSAPGKKEKLKKRTELKEAGSSMLIWV